MTTFIRLLDAPVDDKPTRLRALIQSPPIEGQVFERDPEDFAEVPGSPFAYWVGERIRRLFRALAPFGSQGRVGASGGKTLDDFRWIRAQWEVGLGNGECWIGFAKGGEFSPYYSDVHLLLDWRQDARAMKEYLVTYRSSRGWSPNWTAELHGSEHYLRPGLTWPRRTQSGLNMRVMPPGCVFADKGPAAFVEGNDPDSLLALLAITNSSVFRYLVDLQMAFGSYEVGVIQRTPVPPARGQEVVGLARFARRAWSLKRLLDYSNETSHAFLLPSGLSEKLTGLDLAAIERELAEIQGEVDDRVFDLYGIGPEDRATMEASAKRAATMSPEGDVGAADGDDDEDDSVGAASIDDALVSWLVGVAFGRFDPRLATGERPIPPEPAPFDPLPSRSPGMWPDNEAPIIPPPGIMADDPGDDDDIRSRVTRAAAIAGLPEQENLRQWLAHEFFPLHIKMYSKSRRKAPMYWQLATPSASYSVWLYLHAFSKDTLFRVQNDYVAPKIAHEERRQEAMERELRERATAADRKAFASQEEFVEELRAFLDEVKRVAPLWKPNLDDGVIINFAPLWRLVPQHKPWQKELKATWDSLCKGKYDWAHLAMHFWPERVVPKCAADRSLAIAHGLEEIFWVEGSDGKWTARRIPTRSVEELIRARTSPAVKAALKNLLDAPAAAVGGRGRGGRQRAIAGTDQGGTR